MNLQLATQQQFNSVQCDFWENENNEVFMTINQLAQALEYADKKGVEKLIANNYYIKGEEFSIISKVTTGTDGRGGTQETRIFTEDGIYEITMLSSKPKAREFRAFVRKTLKVLRKGEAVLVYPQSDHDKLQIQKMRAEAMLINAKTRQAKLILDMQKNKTLSPVAIELLNINAMEVIAKKTIEHRPEVEKTYTATDIGKGLGISAQKVGSIANKHNLKLLNLDILHWTKRNIVVNKLNPSAIMKRGKRKLRKYLMELQVDLVKKNKKSQSKRQLRL